MKTSTDLGQHDEKKLILIMTIKFRYLREGLQWKSHSSTQEMRGIVTKSLTLVVTPYF